MTTRLRFAIASLLAAAPVAACAPAPDDSLAAKGPIAAASAKDPPAAVARREPREHSGEPTGNGPSSATEADAAAPAPAEHAYDPASGRFIVHEWGTLTNVVTSDGKLLPGLHHEEEDLPGFVADRMAQAQLTPDVVQQKMETPVTYFYSPSPRTVNAAVSFPHGLFTQWFPYVRATLPWLYEEGPRGQTTITDPWISTPTNLPPQCQMRFAASPSDGRLDWGDVDILARGTAVPLAGPLGKTNWGFARNTAANPLRVRVAGQSYHEKFLFYRGLGNFDLPLEVTSESPNVVGLHNRDSASPMRRAFVLNVTAEGAGLVEVGDVAAGDRKLPLAPDPTLPLPTFVAKLRAALMLALVSDGLYTDEARAMVDTWERSYFLTPGLRVLYILPQAATDQIIPLAITPAPHELKRTMVIRVELVTRQLEQSLAAHLADLASDDGAKRANARAAFLAFGRFAEAYLTRAIALASSEPARAAGETLLADVRSKRRWPALAVE